MRLRLENGEFVEARIKGKRLKPVCADGVTVERIRGEEDWLITSIAPRENELRRPNLSGRVDVLAANVENLLVVAAGTPKPEWSIVDRYLCAAELMGVSAGVMYNKADLAIPSGVDAALGEYEEIGYPTTRCSARSGVGFEDIAALLRERTSIIVGQSGCRQIDDH